MDTFCEQLIVFRKQTWQYLAIAGYWLTALLLSFVAFYFIALLQMITFVLIFGFFYGAWKLSTLFNVEYEYIVTNNTFDIDKITNRFSRKRVLSFDISSVSKVEKFNANKLKSVDRKNILYTCNLNEPNAYLLVIDKEGSGAKYVVFAPNEKVRNEMTKFLPKYISISAFK